MEQEKTCPSDRLMSMVLEFEANFENRQEVMELASEDEWRLHMGAIRAELDQIVTELYALLDNKEFTEAESEEVILHVERILT